MTAVRSCAVRLTVTIAILASVSLAQIQDTKDGNKEFSRLCMVSWLFTPYEVRSNFSVSLLFRQAPLPGIRVVLSPSEELADERGRRRVSVTAVTDSSGAAHFLAVPIGKYTAGAKNGLFFPSNEVTVHSEGEFAAEISIEWPLEALAVQTLRGRLLSPSQGADAERPLRFATVELVDLRSSRVIETQHTVADGSYGFSTVDPGLYVVRVIPPAVDKKKVPASGDLAIELDRSAEQSSIPEVKVLQSDCAGVQLSQRDATAKWER